MDKALQKICALLESPDGMRRCAAAMVLTELAPKDAAVVTALGEALKESNQLLSRYILEAFEAIRSHAAVRYVLPLLNADDIETKLRAAAIVAGAGGECLPELEKQFANANPQQKRIFTDILARIHTREALKLLLDTLFDPDFELVKEACQAVRRHIGDATPKERAALHKQVVSFMNGAAVKKNDRVLTSCLLLVGNIGAADARATLLKFTAPKHLGYLRRNALIGLKGVELAGTAASATARQLIKYLAEPDPVIVQLVLDLIEKLPLTGYDAEWRKLLKSKHSVVRAFATRKLAVTDTPAANKLMLALLAHEDPQVSDVAAGALARHKGATKLLLDTFARERDIETAWRLAKILKPHSEAVDKAAIKKFSAAATAAITGGDQRYEAMLYFLRNIDPKLGDNVLREVGLKFRKAGKWTQAVECLKQLVRGDSFDAELRYELSLCNLKRSAKDLAPGLRADDFALRGFQALLTDKNLKLLDRLKKEAALEAADFYYLGFHFSESVGDERKFGEELLQHLVKKWPASKEGKAAKNKLKLTPDDSAAPAS